MNAAPSELPNDLQVTPAVGQDNFTQNSHRKHLCLNAMNVHGLSYCQHCYCCCCCCCCHPLTSNPNFFGFLAASLQESFCPILRLLKHRLPGLGSSWVLSLSSVQPAIIRLPRLNSISKSYKILFHNLH